jgi:hypothetical protein
MKKIYLEGKHYGLTNNFYKITLKLETIIVLDKY